MDKVLTLEEVAKHDRESDLWIIINDTVYDVTDFLPDHPGGKKTLLKYAGKDGTKEFTALHNPSVLGKWVADKVVGRIATKSKL